MQCSAVQCSIFINIIIIYVCGISYYIYIYIVYIYMHGAPVAAPRRPSSPLGLKAGGLPHCPTSSTCCARVPLPASACVFATHSLRAAGCAIDPLSAWLRLKILDPRGALWKVMLPVPAAAVAFVEAAKAHAAVVLGCLEVACGGVMRLMPLVALPLPAGLWRGVMWLVGRAPGSLMSLIGVPPARLLVADAASGGSLRTLPPFFACLFAAAASPSTFAMLPSPASAHGGTEQEGAEPAASSRERSRAGGRWRRRVSVSRLPGRPSRHGEERHRPLRSTSGAGWACVRRWRAGSWPGRPTRAC